MPSLGGQIPLFSPTSDNKPLAEALEQIAFGGVEERGAVFTRREVVEFILDLCGYTANRKLADFSLLEPSFGLGDFLLVVIERLLASYKRYRPEKTDIISDLGDAITAVELHRESAEKVRLQVTKCLREYGANEKQAQALVSRWILEGDFLLVELPRQYTHVVGNPPYVRQELIPDVLMAEYRTRYETIYDRADLYIPFIERSLRSLNQGGVLGFICADRWMKNRYGGPLRELVAREHHLRYYVDMVGTQAFHAEVSAYPAIFVIGRERDTKTRIGHRPEVDKMVLSQLADAMTMRALPSDSLVTEVAGVVEGSEPWLLESPDQLAIVRRLEAEFPLIEAAGCKVGIGVATGADKVFIASFDELDVEDDRKLPLVRTKDIDTGLVKWAGMGVINPFSDNGSLVPLDKYPRLARYLEDHRKTIVKRNCAKRNPANWYRTIDRIYPELARKPKLLIPDIKGEAHVVYEEGRYYPHHNLYCVTSDEWDLHALQAVLRSRITKLFISTYSTQMRGGFLRFQAQYLRRIRIPNWKDVPQTIRKELVEAAMSGNAEACDFAAFRLYRLSDVEKAALGGNGKE